MIFLECLRVQTGLSADTDTVPDLCSRVQQELDRERFVQGHIAARVDQPGEVMVQLRWEQANLERRGSPLAQALVSELRNHGLVSYTAWVEDQGFAAAESRLPDFVHLRADSKGEVKEETRHEE